MDYDYELEKRYHPENFERELDEEALDWEDEVKLDEPNSEEEAQKEINKYNIEVRDVILQGIKL